MVFWVEEQAQFAEKRRWWWGTFTCVLACVRSWVWVTVAAAAAMLGRRVHVRNWQLYVCTVCTSVRSCVPLKSAREPDSAIPVYSFLLTSSALSFCSFFNTSLCSGCCWLCRMMVQKKARSTTLQRVVSQIQTTAFVLSHAAQVCTPLSLLCVNAPSFSATTHVHTY